MKSAAGKKLVLNHVRIESPDVQWRLHPPLQQTPGTKDPSAGAQHRGIALPIEIEDLLVTKGSIRMEESLTLPGKEMKRAFLNIELKASSWRRAVKCASVSP